MGTLVFLVGLSLVAALTVAALALLGLIVVAGLCVWVGAVERRGAATRRPPQVTHRSRSNVTLPVSTRPALSTRTK